MKAEEIQAVYKVSAYDSSFSVMLSYADSVGDLLRHGEVSAKRNRLKIMRMSGQVVTVRIHWLPIYFDNFILKEILSQFDEVVGIRMLKSAHAQVVAFDGVKVFSLHTCKRHLLRFRFVNPQFQVFYC